MNQNGVVCLLGRALFFFIFRFEYLISGPKSYRDIRETGPWALIKFLDLESGRLLTFSAFKMGAYSNKYGSPDRTRRNGHFFMKIVFTVF